MAQDKEIRSIATVGINIQIPLSVSIELSRRCLDLKEQGQKVTKAQLLIDYAKEGLNKDYNIISK